MSNIQSQDPILPPTASVGQILKSDEVVSTAALQEHLEMDSDAGLPQEYFQFIQQEN